MPTATANGKKFNFPEGTTNQQMAQAIEEYFSKNPAQSTPPVQSNALDPEQEGSFLNALAQGIFNLDDEVGGAMGALVGTMLPESMGGLPDDVSFQDAYKGIRENIIRKREAFSDRNPWGSTGLSIVGGALTGGAAAAKAGSMLLPAGKTLANRAALGATVGATEGAAFGAGGADDGDRVEGAAMGGAIGAATGGLAAGALHKLGASYEAKSMLKRQAADGSADSSLAKFRLSPKGKLVSDEYAKKAIDNGFSERFVQQAKTAHPTDKKDILKMIRISKRSLRDGRFAQSNRVSDVFGNRLSGRVQKLIELNRDAASKLDSVEDSLKGQSVDYSEAVGTFLRGLEKLGIEVDTRGSISVDVSNSAIEGATRAQDILSRIMNRMTNTRTPDAYDVHRLKGFIHEQVVYGSGVDSGLKGKVLFRVKELGRNIDKALDDAFPEYNQVNTQYSETISAIDNLKAALQTKIDVSEEFSAREMGVQSRKLLSNYASGPRQMEAIQEVEHVLSKYGVKVDGNIMDLVTTDTAIRSVMPNQGINTLEDTIGRSVDGVVNSVRDPSLLGVASRGIKSIARKDRNDRTKTARKALDALEKSLLRSLRDSKGKRVSDRKVKSTSVPDLPALPDLKQPYLTKRSTGLIVRPRGDIDGGSRNPLLGD